MAKDTRFKKGQSGNPKGRELGSKNVNTEKITQMIDLIISSCNDEDIKKSTVDTVKKNFGTFLSFLGRIAPKDFNVGGSVTNKVLEALDKADSNNNSDNTDE